MVGMSWMRSRLLPCQEWKDVCQQIVDHFVGFRNVSQASAQKLVACEDKFDMFQAWTSFCKSNGVTAFHVEDTGSIPVRDRYLFVAGGIIAEWSLAIWLEKVARELSEKAKNTFFLWITLLWHSMFIMIRFERACSRLIGKWLFSRDYLSPDLLFLILIFCLILSE